MSNLHEKFEAYLASVDSRYTTQKRAIVEEILTRKGMFEVDAFIHDIRKGSKTFSRATVYRVIKQLIEASLLQKITTRDGKVYYEHHKPQQQHHHLICNTCGNIFEIKDASIEKNLEIFCNKQSFHPSYRSLHIYGE